MVNEPFESVVTLRTSAINSNNPSGPVVEMVVVYRVHSGQSELAENLEISTLAECTVELVKPVAREAEEWTGTWLELGAAEMLGSPLDACDSLELVWWLELNWLLALDLWIERGFEWDSWLELDSCVELDL